jgi:predicted AlkP superfamily phosphohydrolase/phosphomutase/tetratricopeptide (TPR) repeat protein
MADMHARTAKRLLVIGWDAADWILINRLFAGGRMPVLRRLVDAGARADLGTLEPKLSPLLWSSIATGKTADKHGILNFVEPKPDGSGLRVSASTSRRTKALWNILSQNGLVTHVVGWYASHPAEPIRGSVVTNLLQEGEPAGETQPWPLVPGTVHPDGRADAIAAARQRAQAFPRESLKALLPKVDEIGAGDERVRTLVKLMSHAASIERAAIAQLTDGGAWDAAMVFFDAIDTVGHHFMQFAAPRMAHVSEREQRLFGGVMDAVYEWHDAALGRLLAAAGPETTVILLSDHGFHSDHLRPNLSDLPPERRMELESSWHRPQGVLVLSGPGVRRGATIASPTILDVAPTALALLGLGAGEDFDGRVLAEAITCDAPPRVPSWDAVEGDAGLHPADMRQDVFEASDAIRQLVDLGYMAALPDDVQGQLDLVRRESLFNLAVALMSRRRGHEAIPHFERLVAERPGEARYALLLANCLLGAGRPAEAAARIGAFLELDPKNLEAQLLRAAALALSGDDRGARAQLEPIERAARSRPELALSLGGVLGACGRHADARAYFEQAKARNPRDPAAHVGLARMQLALGGFEQAAEHALDALEISQALPEAHLLLGAALAWYGDLDNARKSIGFAIAHDAGQLDAHRWLALVHAKAGDVAYESDARAEVERLAATIPAGARPKDAPFGPADFAAKHGLDPV